MADLPEIQTRKGDSIKTGPMYRAFAVTREMINVDARTVSLAFSSETPYERWFGIEVLDHSPTSVRLGRLKDGGAVLLEHDTECHVGVVESVEIGADRVGRAVVRFGRTEDADEAFQLIVDGIKRHVSVGYIVHKMVLSESKDGAETYTVTDWEPLEISLVAIPADPTVGVGRAAGAVEVETRIERPAPAAAPAVVVETIPPTPKQEKHMSEINADQVRADAVSAHSKNIAEMIDIGEKWAAYGADKKAAEFIRAGKTPAELREAVMSMIATNHTNAAAKREDLGLTLQEAKQYSLFRAINAAASGDWSDAGFELAVQKEMQAKFGVSQRGSNGGRQASIYVPIEVQKRDLTAGSAAGGGYLVATNNAAGSFIEMLRNRSVAMTMGATRLPGLVGNVTIPKQTGAATAYWLSTEATSITESNQTFGQVALSPKNVAAYTEISRQLTLQSAPAAEQLVMNDLARVVALGVDSAVLSGSGASGQPQGIIGTNGVGSVTGTSIAYAGILEFQTDVMTANAMVNPAAFGYVTTPAVAALLAQRQRFTSTDTPLWQGNLFDGTVSGFKAMSSVQVPTANILAGDWSQVVVGEWGVLEVEVNPYAQFQSAIIGVRAIYTVDVGVRYGASFSLATSVT